MKDHNKTRIHDRRVKASFKYYPYYTAMAKERIKRQVIENANAVAFSKFIRQFPPKIQAKVILDRVDHPEYSLQQLMDLTFIYIDEERVRK